MEADKILQFRREQAALKEILARWDRGLEAPAEIAGPALRQIF
jgi:hypothetical protein